MPIGGVTVCLDTLQESSGAPRVCPGPLEQQLLQKGASELPIATMARHNQFLGRASSIHCPADMLRTPATAVHDLLGGCWTCSIFACGSVLSICSWCLKRFHASRLSVISQDLTAAPCCPAAQGGGSHHSSGRARSSACAAAASTAGCEGTSCNCGTSQLIMQPISFTPFAVPCTIAKQCALPAAS